MAAAYRSSRQCPGCRCQQHAAVMKAYPPPLQGMSIGGRRTVHGRGTARERQRVHTSCCCCRHHATAGWCSTPRMMAKAAVAAVPLRSQPHLGSLLVAACFWRGGHMSKIPFVGAVAEVWSLYKHVMSDDCGPLGYLVSPVNSQALRHTVICHARNHARGIAAVAA